MTGTVQPAPEGVLAFLGRDLVAILAGLDGAPPNVCQSTLQLLPFGSRAALEATGLATAGPEVDGTGRRVLVLTPLAFRVMAVAAAAEREPGVGEDVADEWDARASAARVPRSAR